MEQFKILEHHSALNEMLLHPLPDCTVIHKYRVRCPDDRKIIVFVKDEHDEEEVIAEAKKLYEKDYKTNLWAYRKI